MPVAKSALAHPLGPETLQCILECGGGGRASAGRIYGDHRHPKGSLASGGHVYFSLSHSTRTPPPHTTALLGAVRSLYNNIIYYMYTPPKYTVQQ